jgi:hypothetical protein
MLRIRHHPDADPDPAFHFDAGPILTFHSEADPDPFPDLDPPMLQNDPLYGFHLFTLMWIRILIFNLMPFDPDPAFHFDADADPDLASQNDADPDPQHWSKEP